MPMEQPTEEQIERFWVKCGLIEQPTGSWYEDKVGGIFISNTMPTMTLNHIFKYAIPKLQDEGYRIDIQCLEHKGYRVLIYKIATDVLVARVADDDLGLALFGAIWGVIK